MKYQKKVGGFCFIGMSIILLASFSYCSKNTTRDIKMVNSAFNTQDIVALFARNSSDIKSNVEQFLHQAQSTIDAMIAIPADQRTFANTAKVLDELVSLSNLAIAQRVYEA